MAYSNLFVVLMGIGTVFIGLVCIIILVTIMSKIVRKTEKASEIEDASRRFNPADMNQPVIHPSVEKGVITDELIAAISAAIAEDMGTDASGLRILSLRKV